MFSGLCFELLCAQWATLCSVGCSVLSGLLYTQRERSFVQWAFLTLGNCIVLNGLLCAQCATLASGSSALLFGLLCSQWATLYPEGYELCLVGFADLRLLHCGKWAVLC